jgi:uncharacterized protein
MSASEIPAFAKEGLRFQCQGSGQCCVARGTYGYVYLNIHDRRRMAKHLKIATGTFTKKFCLKQDGFFYLADSKKQCRFLEGTRCSVYEARPNQCRTWPFWPEHMTAKNWSEAAKFCKGIGKGPVYTPDHIQALLALNDL